MKNGIFVKNYYKIKKIFKQLILNNNEYIFNKKIKAKGNP
jgi:hypothetical protein